MNRLFSTTRKATINYFLKQNSLKNSFTFFGRLQKFTFSSKNNEEIVPEKNENDEEKKVIAFKEPAIETKEQEENPLKYEGVPLIYHVQPIVPFSSITKKVSPKDPLYYLAIKYGKVTQKDEETTIIDDLIINFEKDSKKVKDETNLTYGIKCQIEIKNTQLTMTGLDKIVFVKSTFGLGKYKFIKPNQLEEISVKFDTSLKYYEIAKQLFEGIMSKYKTISNKMENKEDFIDDLKFNFDPLEIETSYQKLSQEILNEQVEEKKAKLVENFCQEIYKYLYFYLIRLNQLKTQFFGMEFDFSKYFQTFELFEKLLIIEEELTNFDNILTIKYDKFGFKHKYSINLDDPFNKSTEENIARIIKYKQNLEVKMKGVDKVETQKEEFRNKLNSIKNMENETRLVIEAEINKINSNSFDFENSKRTEYINHCLSLPWDKFDEPDWDLDYSKKVLEKNMYGLEEVKNKIYEFIAKNKRKNNKKGCIILLHGGPGTGKTRIAKLIGETLKRKVGFISLAGESDNKNLLGHKRVYVNSCPGVFVKEIQKLGTKNPVIVLDEIDKVISSNGKSNIFYSLLQILNPEESSKFTDHYLEIPFDFSNVIFIITSNNSKVIFPALLDRIQSFKIEPYIDKEKYYIAKKYMLKQIIEEFNFDPKYFNFNDDSITYIIEKYCKFESGVRKLNKYIEAAVRKVCFLIEKKDIESLKNEKILLPYNNCEVDYKNVNFESLSLKKSSDSVEESKYRIEISNDNIIYLLKEASDSDYVLNEFIKSDNLVGTCVGLTVSSSSQSNSFGDAMKISLSITKSNKHINSLKLLKHPKLNTFKFHTTGKIQDIFKQSLEIALIVASRHLITIDKKKFQHFYYQNEIHFHLPQMLVSKDGPSAGVGLYLCAMSLALNKPIKNQFALTGEISIDGKVLVIGGVREKCQGALRYDIKHIAIPIGNKGDFDKLPYHIKDSFENVYFVENYLDVYNIAFDGDTTGIRRHERQGNVFEIEEMNEINNSNNQSFS